MACGEERWCMDGVFGGQEFDMYIVLMYNLIVELERLFFGR